jgi:hypothetical protein
MLLNKFSEKYRLIITRNADDGTDIIAGTEGHSHIFQYSDDLLGVMIMPHTGTAHRWKSAKEEFLRVGMVIRQDAEAEGTATFNAEDPEQVRAVLKYANIRRKRVVSESVLQRLEAMGFKKGQTFDFFGKEDTQEGDLIV